MALSTENLARLRAYQYKKARKGLTGICPTKHAALTAEHRLMTEEQVITMLDADDAQELARELTNQAAIERKAAAVAARIALLQGNQ